MMQNGSRARIDPDPPAPLTESAYLSFEPTASSASGAHRDTRSTSKARRGQSSSEELDPPSIPHGYSGGSALPDISPVLGKPDSESQIHPDLRSPYYAPPPTMMPSAMSSASEMSSSIAGPSGGSMGPPPLGMVGDEGITDGRKAKRELSQSKRAAQNRAAQRAFRQRKEGYIKKLEQQVRDYNELENNYKAIQAENFSLREYVISLRSCLLDAKIEPPPHPPNISLHYPHQHGPLPPVALPPSAPAAGGSASSVMPPPPNPLAEVAQAVAQLGVDNQYSSKSFKPDRPNEEARTDDEISRQLQADRQLPPDGLSAPM